MGNVPCVIPSYTKKHVSIQGEHSLDVKMMIVTLHRLYEEKTM